MCTLARLRVTAFFFSSFFFMCVYVCVNERVSQRRGCLVNVVGNSILDDMQLKALGYNNCQAWQHLTGLWARIEGQMECGAS